MRRYILHIVLFIGFAGFSQNLPTVTAKADTTTIKIGERINYEIVVDNANKGVVFTDLELDSLGRVELVESFDIDTLKNQLIKKYALTSFDSGRYVIPRQRILIWSQEYLTDSLKIDVFTVEVDTTKQQMYTIKAIQNEPYTFEDFKNYLWWILGILLILGLILYVVLKKNKDLDENGEPIIAPYQEAIQKLRQLDEKQLWQNNRVKEYYSELTSIVRYYIERELKIPALERTTDGLIDTLKDFKEADVIVTTKETIDKLKDLLKEADLVKFAKSKPLANEIENDRTDAEEIINTLQPAAVVSNLPEVENVVPIILVQKPKYKTPNVVVKSIIILGLLLIGALLIYGIFMASQTVQNINNEVVQEQNPINQSTDNVE